MSPKILLSICIVFSTFFLFSADSIYDFTLHCPSSGISTNSLEIDYRLIFSDPEAIFLINPKFKPHFNGDIETSFGMGVRKKVEKTLIGFNFCADYGYLMKTSHFQMGPGVEYFTDNWEFRSNLYFPMSAIKQQQNYIIEAHTYLDTELLYKVQDMQFGLKPCYDISEESSGIFGIFRFPFNDFSLAVTAGYDNFKQKHCLFSISFGFYGDNKSSLIHSPIRRHCGIIHTKKKMLPSAPLELKEIEEINGYVRPLEIAFEEEKKSEEAYLESKEPSVTALIEEPPAEKWELISDKSSTSPQESGDPWWNHFSKFFRIYRLAIPEDKEGNNEKGESIIPID